MHLCDTSYNRDHFTCRPIYVDLSSSPSGPASCLHLFQFRFFCSTLESTTIGLRLFTRPLCPPALRSDMLKQAPSQAALFNIFKNGSDVIILLFHACGPFSPHLTFLFVRAHQVVIMSAPAVESIPRS